MSNIMELIKGAVNIVSESEEDYPGELKELMNQIESRIKAMQEVCDMSISWIEDADRKEMKEHGEACTCESCKFIKLADKYKETVQ